jgi:hypothetical protein
MVSSQTNSLSDKILDLKHEHKLRPDGQRLLGLACAVPPSQSTHLYRFRRQCIHRFLAAAESAAPMADNRLTQEPHSEEQGWVGILHRPTTF